MGPGGTELAAKKSVERVSVHRGVSNAWLEAEREAPHNGSGSFKGAYRQLTFTSSYGKADTFSVAFGSLLAALLAGGLWFWSEAIDLVDRTWLTVAVGLMVGVVVRVTSARLPASIRAGMAITVYVVTALVLAFIRARIEVGDIYGDMATAADYERNLRTRFGDASQLAAYAAGAAIAWGVNKLGGR